MPPEPDRATPPPPSQEVVATPESGAETAEPVTWRTTAVGLVMGAADIVPGVSGGTVALVLGVYHRLLTAITRCDRQAIGLLIRGQWSALARRVDLVFLLALGLGIAIGVKGLASLVTYLLSDHRQVTFAAFFGLILASGVLVARMAKPNNAAGAARCVAFGIVAAGFAVWLLSQGRLQPVAGLGYTALSGSIAICAMILPGVSGAYLLLMFGKYEEVSGIIHRLPSITGADAATLVAFVLGCGLGLLLFSRFLKWLLDRYAAATLATLAGFMIGSLYRVWPFQRDTTPEVEEFKLKVFEPVWPPSFDGQAITCLAVATICFVGVLATDALATGRAKRGLGED